MLYYHPGLMLHGLMIKSLDVIAMKGRVIGERMKDARLNCGMSQWDVANALHCDQTTISRMERGQISPDCSQIRVLSSLFQLSILYLMGYPTFVVSVVDN